MCEVVAKGRRTFREQDPPRIREDKRSNGEGLPESSSCSSLSSSSRSTPTSPTVQQRGLALEKCLSEPRFLETDQTSQTATGKDQFLRELSLKVPSCSRHDDQVIINGLSRDTDSCEGQPNGRKMAPVLGVPPPPPPAPHMGPDGLILPRKPYNPCLTSGNHKDLHRELLFNQKIGRNVLNQKSELQRALEKQREAASRREAEKSREETFKDDPRTALQRAIEQRAKHIQMTLEQSQPTTEPPSNLLITARAKLRPRTDSQ